MPRHRPLIACLLIAVAATSALAQDGLTRCRAIGETVARLACYDALEPQAAVPRQAPPPPAPTAAPARAVSDPTNFGLAGTQRAAEPDSVQSRVADDFGGWTANSTIRLANGQIWQVTDGTSLALPTGARGATVRRGAFGAYYLHFEGLNTAPRVRRVQ